MALSKFDHLELDIGKIVKYTQFSEKESVSIDIIHGYLGGPEHEYRCCEKWQSFKCYNICKADSLETMEASKLPVLYFEDYNTEINDIICCVLHQKKERGV